MPEEGNVRATTTRTCREDRGAFVNVTLKMLLLRLTWKAKLREIRLPRPPAHVRHAFALEERSSEDISRDAWAHKRGHHPHTYSLVLLGMGDQARSAMENVLLWRVTVR